MYFRDLQSLSHGSIRTQPTHLRARIQTIRSIITLLRIFSVLNVYLLYCAYRNYSAHALSVCMFNLLLYNLQLATSADDIDLNIT